jgi:hypothetical protein
MGRSPIIIRPLRKSLYFPTLTGRPSLKNLCIFPPRQVAHYNKTTLKNLCVFLLSRLPIIIRPPWKIFVFFLLGRSPITIRPHWKSLYFSPDQVTHYNEITRKKIFVFFYLDRSPITMRPLWKNLCIFFLSWRVTHDNLTISKSLNFTNWQVAWDNHTTSKKKSFSFSQRSSFSLRTLSFFSFECAF